ncbi:MAG: hypothetical protein NC401_13905 [Ruminococcus sp.]|nr:hypothetical protein [Ruminococcus sp.]
MTNYLIIYGDDNSFFDVVASSLIDAVFKFAKYTGMTLKPICEKALRAMTAPDEIVALFNHVTYCDEEIRAVYEVKKVTYPPQETEQKKDGDSNG